MLKPQIEANFTTLAELEQTPADPVGIRLAIDFWFEVIALGLGIVGLFLLVRLLQLLKSSTTNLV